MSGSILLVLLIGVFLLSARPRNPWFVGGLALVVIATAVTVFVIVPNTLVRSNTNLSSDLLKARNDVRLAIIQIIGGAVLLVGLLFTYRQNQLSRETLQVTQQSQITERFTRAIDHLGSDKPDVRIGGIFALEKIAKESKPDADPIIRLLAAYLRDHRPWTAAAPPTTSSPSQSSDVGQDWKSSCTSPLPSWATSSVPPMPPDVQAAIAVLKHLLPKNRILALDLSSAQLEGFNLHEFQMPGANLAATNLAFGCITSAVLNDANLDGAVLSYADLTSAQLQGAGLHGAMLSPSFLSGALLSGAKLVGADLSYAGLSGADLRRADLTGANLSYSLLLDAQLRGAKLFGADLTGAKNVTQEQIDSALTDETTKLPSGLRVRSSASTRVPDRPFPAR